MDFGKLLGIKSEDMENITELIGKGEQTLKEIHFIYLIAKAYYYNNKADIDNALMKMQNKKEVKENE